MIFLTEEGGKAALVGNLQAMRESLIKLLEDIAKISTSIQRPECLSREGKVQFLPEFPL
jgi:hypothetical protein